METVEKRKHAKQLKPHIKRAVRKDYWDEFYQITKLPANFFNDDILTNTYNYARESIMESKDKDYALQLMDLLTQLIEQEENKR